MTKTLEKMNCGDIFLKAIEAIYSNQHAMLIVNNASTGKFKITKGTRQGCPLLLFILVLQVLTKRIRSGNEIKGITVGQRAYKLLYQHLQVMQ